MLKLYNKEHEAISALTNLKDYKIEYVLSGEDLLEFSLSISDENIRLVEEEGYIRNKNNEYVIKAIDHPQNFKRFSCVVNIESIKAKSIKSFDTSNNNLTDTIRLAIAGTGWILADNNINKRRTVRVKNANALEVLREIRKVFRVDFRFDAINKIIYVYEQYGSDKGVYFSDELNLISLNIPSDTYDYATRLYCYGKDGLTIASVNNGKEYIENFQYSNKVIELIWQDNRYTDINSLKSDAEAKLEELSKPKRSYQASISDLSKQNDEYRFLDFFIGDTITLLSKSEKFRDKQRIVKYIEYPHNPSKNTCELGNTTLTFEELQKENEAKNVVVDNITSDNGTVDGSKVDSITTEQIRDFEASVAKITDLTVINADIANLKAQNVTITGELNAVKASIGTLNANIATIDRLTVTHTAQINDLKANSATITQLNATNANIGILEANVAKIQTLVNGNLSSENIQAGGITSDKLNIENGFITNAMIANLDVSKINAGDISTNKFKIKSDDGGIEIVGATQQFKDKNNKIRIQMGKDEQGNFNFIIRGEDGTTTLIDHTGIKKNAIENDLIVSDMIASDAVGEKQLNYSSFITGFNKDTNTNTIKSTKIMFNNQNQTLDVAFNQLKTQADGTKTLTESHSTTIVVMQGQINTAINNTQIVKDGQTILLKDDYNRTVATVNSINSTIGTHSTQINQATGKIEAVQAKVNTVERDLNSITARVSSTETNVTTISNTANNALTNANNANNKIDANTKEITTTKNKVSTIELNLSSITSKVTSIENVQTSVNGKIISLETFKKEAEQKITPDAIVNTVTSSTQWKNKGDISRLRLKINYSNLTKESPGEMFLYGVDDNGKDLSNGTVKVSLSGKDYNIPIEQHNPCYNGLDVPINQTIYLCYCTGYKEVFSCWSTKNGWKKLRTSSTKMQDSNNKIEGMEWGTYHVIASYIMSEKESIKSAVVYDYPVKDLSGMASNAELKILSDEINFKVDKGGIVTAINLSGEAAKIKSTKIQLEGAVSVGDSDGNYVHIDNANYTIRDSGNPKAFFGFKKMDNTGYDKYVVPKLAMGAYGYKSNHNYFTIVPYRGNDNPQGISNAYVDIAYHNLKNDDFSNIKMYDGGDIRLAPVKNLEITTNYSNGAYAGTGERKLAVFSTSALSDYNSNLQIGVIANHSNGNGLILADRGKDSPWEGSGLPSNGSSWRTAVRVNTDSSGNKFFRPFDNKGDIANGSSGYPWKSLHSKTTYSSEGITARNIAAYENSVVYSDDVLDNISFINTLKSNELIMDVTNLQGSKYVEVCDTHAYINNTEMIKLLILEIKKIKENIK